jgi:AraC-like DNA-binding protein
MTPGALVLNAAGRKLRAINAGPCTILHIYVPTVLVAETLMSEGSGDRDVEFVSPDSRLQDAALSRVSDQIFSELHNPAAFPRLRVDALGLTVVDALLQRHSNIAARWSATHPERGGLAPWQLKRAQEAMLSQLGADLGLDDLAAVAGCSTTHFSRAFKQSTGIAPFYWLAERRIDKAKELLADPRLSLAEIALAVGFSAQPHFTTAFKRATGTTPGEWRRQRLF